MEEAKAELQALLHDKKANYAQYVRDVHKPVISLTKQVEMQNLKDRLKHPVRESLRVSPGQALISFSKLNRSNSQNDIGYTSNVKQGARIILG